MPESTWHWFPEKQLVDIYGTLPEHKYIFSSYLQTNTNDAPRVRYLR